MPVGYCTVEDVRRVLQKADLPGPLQEGDNQAVVDAIAALTDPVEKATKRHWYVEDGIAENDHELVPESPKTRDDEHDISTHGGWVLGANERRRKRTRKNSDALLESGPNYDYLRKHNRRKKRDIRLAFGDVRDDGRPAYTRVTLERKDVEAVNELHVANADGGFDEWTTELEGGVGNEHRGEDYWVRINNRGISELYLNVHSMDDDIASLANAVYIDIDYGFDGLPTAVKRGVALLAASEHVLDDELVTAIPDSGQLVNVETKAERWGRLGVQKLEPYLEDSDILESYR